MSKNKAALVFFLIFVALPHLSAQTLKEAIQQAISNHPDVLVNRAQTLAAKESIHEARGGYYPAIDVNGGFGREWTDSPLTKDIEGDTQITLNRQEFSVSMTQNLYAGGSITNEVQRNVFAFQSQDYKTQGVSNDVALTVTEAYLNVLLHTELVELAKKNLAEHHRIFNLIEERRVAGISRAAEYAQAASRVALAEANLVSEQGNYRESIVKFRKLVGCLPKELVNPEPPGDHCIPKTLEQAFQEGINNHPLVKSSYADVNEAKAQRDVANGAFAPKVDGILSASRNKNLDGLRGKNNDNLAMIRVSYNVFKGGGDWGHLRKTAYQVQEAIETRYKTILDMKETLALSYNALEASSKRATALAEYVKSTADTKAAYFEQFQIGQRSLLDLLNTQNEENNAKNDYLKTKNDEILAKYRILNGIGTLVPFIARSQQSNRATPLFQIDLLPSKTISPHSTALPMPLPSLSLEGMDELIKAAIFQIGSIRPAPKLSQIPSAPLGEVKEAAVVAANNFYYVVQVVSLKNKKDAENIKSTLLLKGYKASIESVLVNEILWYRVIVGPFLTRTDADNMLNSIDESEHLRGIVRKIIGP